MSLALTPTVPGRSTRLTVLVNDGEAAQIARQAAAAGLSVSAYLRERALGIAAAPEASPEAALRQMDGLIARMEADLDGAIAALAQTGAA